MKSKGLLGLVAACAMALVCTPSVQAQSADGEGISFGFRAGVNLSNAAMNDDAKRGTDPKMLAGFHVGAIVDIPVMQSLYVQPGLYFSTKGVKTEYENSEYPEENSETSVNAMYLEIPINVSWRYNFSDMLQLQVYTGPYFAVGVGGKTKTTYGDGEIKTTGTDIDRLMPPVSRFGGNARAKKKQMAIDKLKVFFERFFGIGGPVFKESAAPASDEN